MAVKRSREELLQEIDELRMRLDEAEETLRVIGRGEVDAFVISGEDGDQVFTLKGAEQPYRILVETMNEGAVTLSSDGIILYCNNSLANMLHRPLKGFVGTPISTYVATDDHPLLAALLNTSSLECKKDEIRFITGQGDPVPTLISCCAFDPLGAQGRVVVITDLTQQKRSEEFMAEERLTRSIIEQAEEVILVCDEKGRIIRASRLAHQLCNENPLLKQFDEVVPLRLTQTGRVFSLLPAMAEKNTKNIEVESRQSDGRNLHFLLNASPLKGAQDVNIGIVLMLTDITERKQNEETRIKLEEQLRQAQKMEAIGTLAGGIAHDFNNILGAILGYSEMAKEDCTPGSSIENDLNQVIVAGHRAKDLVKQILSFSHQTVSENKLLQPAVIVEETLKLLRSSLPTTITIQQDIKVDTGLIYVDPTQIHQILMNLCTNAYHAMEDKGGLLTISLRERTLSKHDLLGVPHIQPGNFVELSVRDNGLGMSQDLQEKIFDPYFTTKEVGKGTGMGLAIVHGIVKSYGGYISCNSQVGEGTEFTILLPVIQGNAATEIKNAQSTPAGTEHILLDDDEKILVEMSSSMLQRMGYTVTARTSSVEALATFTNQPDAYDLVITDQTMPGMTGIDLARRMLQIRPELPIILCTGYSSQISKEKVKSYGIKGFAMKPLARADIATMIRKVLGQA
jgi:PAS domain S-box-containing protein